MKTRLLALTIAALLIGAPSIADEGVKWVSDTGHAMKIAGPHTMMFHEGGETFDLSDLRDGETRDFGQGDKQITVTREGDDVLIMREQSGEESALELKCDVNDDTCQVVTFADDPEKVMIVVSKTRTCVNEDGNIDGDCEANIDVIVEKLGGLDGLAEFDHHAVIRTIECDDDGNCEELEEVLRDGLALSGHGEMVHGENIMVMAGAHHLDGKVMLTCPEGDATVTVDKEEADDTFLCPKHSVPMELAKHPKPFVQKIRIKKGE